MAEIRGVLLKDLKHFQGTDFPGYAAKVMLDDKFIGNMINSGNGGDIDLMIKENADENELTRRMELYFTDHVFKYSDRDIFFEQLVFLIEREKQFKKQLIQAAKKYGSNPKLSVSMIIVTVNDFQEEEWFVYSEEQLETVKKELESNNQKYTVYKKLEDFKIK